MKVVEKTVNIKRIEITDNIYERVLSLFKGKVFHLTKSDNLDKIAKDGFIFNNFDDSYVLNTGSAKSFGRLMKYVCLFDFRHLNDEETDEVHMKYSFSSPSWFTEEKPEGSICEMTAFILSPDYYNQLIPNGAASLHIQQTGECYQYIPKAEVWFKDKIPVGHFETVLRLEIKCAAPKNIWLNAVRLATASRKK